MGFVPIFYISYICIGIGNVMKKEIDPIFRAKLAKLIAQMGFELFGYELFSRGRQKLFRIYIDSKQGINIDDCAAVSRQVSALMDVEDPIAERYTLEVSSPGVDRPLFEIEHYSRYLGSSIKVMLKAALNGHKKYKGMIKRVEGEDIYLLVEGTKQEVVLPFSMIEKANLIGEVGFQNA